MHLTKLALNHFRRYREIELEFPSGITLIHGNNAVGKTTLLEAVFFAICGRSFRTKQLNELCMQGSNLFTIETTFCKRTIGQKLHIAYQNKEKSLHHNKTRLPSTTSLLGLLQGVMMSPDDVALIKGAPAIRRAYLDLQLAQADPLYVHHLTRYYRAMRHRNTLLRSKQPQFIEPWEIEMAKSAVYLHQERRGLVDELNTLVKPLYATLTEEPSPLSLTYRSPIHSSAESLEIENHYRTLYAKTRQKEMAVGHTLHGPHKDDLNIWIGELDSRSYASEGQQRCCVLAFRFAEWQRLARCTGEKPLLLLDDVTTFLDQNRSERVFAQIGEFGQVILTATKDIALSSSKQQIHKLNLT